MSAVVLDASGQVVGGGSGATITSLPPSSREFFKLSSGFSSIPMTKAATALVSLEPRWVPSG
jgi:hypothetical protein